MKRCASQLHYMRRGSGPPVVLVHGFLGGIAEWEELVARLAPCFDTLAIDLPGFGGSAEISAPAILSGYADLLAELLDALEIESCMLLGHSLGSMIAQQFAVDHAHRVERLILYGAASTGQLPGRFETFDVTIDRCKRIGILQAAAPIIASWFVTGRTHPGYAMYRRMAEAARTDAAITALRAVAQWEITERLGEITIPTLVIGGDRDRSTELAEQLQLWRGLPRGQLCVLPNCAHAAHLEQPELFERVIARFLTER